MSVIAIVVGGSGGLSFSASAIRLAIPSHFCRSAAFIWAGLILLLRV